MHGMWKQYIAMRPALEVLARLIMDEYEGKTRTVAQNAYYWKVIIGIMSEETGYTPKECHDHLKWELLPHKTYTDRHGVEHENVGDSHNLKIKQWQMYEDCARMQVQAWTGAHVPLPNEPPMEAYE